MGKKFATSEVFGDLRMSSKDPSGQMLKALFSGGKLLYDNKKKLYYTARDEELHNKYLSNLRENKKDGVSKNVEHKHDMSTADDINKNKIFKALGNKSKVDETIFEKLKALRKVKESPEGMGEVTR